MAALELHCGPEPVSCVWGGDRADLLDSFDSDMQEWEDQLQDMQRKIEEVRQIFNWGDPSQCDRIHIHLTVSISRERFLLKNVNSLQKYSALIWL